MIKGIIELIFSAALFLNALLFIPQAVRIVIEKSAKGISLVTFSGFLIIQLAIVSHAAIMHDYLLMVGYLLSLLTCGSVVLLTLLYRRRGTQIANEIDLADIIAQMPEHVYWKDTDGRFKGSNTNNWKDFGFHSLDEHIGKNDYECFPAEQAQKLYEIDKKVMTTGQPAVAEEWCVLNNGFTALYLSHKVPLKNYDGKIVGLLGISVDITKTRQEIADKLDFLENIIAEMPGNVYWMNREGVYLGCNNNQAQFMALKSRKDIVGKRNIDIDNFVIPEVLDAINKQVLDQGKTIITEEPAILPNGSQGTFLSSKVPIKNSRHEVVGM
ncbi:MAG: PAS domain-containing protein, partial [Gammaproteobacteria bacterium]|nr:PAS domain-containing protein [Gammaproteobacteria bacterium]